MSTTIHCHWGKDGRPFGTLRDTVQAVLDVPYPNVPMGCPRPKKDGTCPGHKTRKKAGA